MWSRNKANLYIRDALDDFHCDPKALPSPIAQRKIYRNKLMLTHLVGFGGGSAPLTTLSYNFASTGSLSVGDHSDWTLGGDNFVMEMRVRWIGAAHTGATHFITHWGVAGKRGFKWDWDGDNNNMRFVYTTNGTDMTIPSWSWTPSADTWYAIALARTTTNLRAYVDGSEIGSTFDISTDSIFNSDRILSINNMSQGGGAKADFVDEIRISDVNRSYSGATYTVASEEFTSDANTTLLIHCNETIASGTTGSQATFVDSGNTGHTVTETLDAIRSSDQFVF
ncbi:MAG: hypothetical protein QGH83_11830 [Candidatus Pacebacteria bacterium]|nr:hypothetical protein [Candidatus Paceibacterota bacterium]